MQIDWHLVIDVLGPVVTLACGAWAWWQRHDGRIVQRVRDLEARANEVEGDRATWVPTVHWAKDIAVSLAYRVDPEFLFPDRPPAPPRRPELPRPPDDP